MNRCGRTSNAFNSCRAVTFYISNRLLATNPVFQRVKNRNVTIECCSTAVIKDCLCFKSVAVVHLSLCLYCMKFLTVHFKKAITRNSANSCCIQNPNFSARSSAVIRCSRGPSLVGNSKIPLKAVEEFRMDVRLDPKVVVIVKEDYRGGGISGMID